MSTASLLIVRRCAWVIIWSCQVLGNVHCKSHNQFEVVQHLAYWSVMNVTYLSDSFSQAFMVSVKTRRSVWFQQWSTLYSKVLGKRIGIRQSKKLSHESFERRRQAAKLTPIQRVRHEHTSKKKNLTVRGNYMESIWYVGFRIIGGGVNSAPAGEGSENASYTILNCKVNASAELHPCQNRPMQWTWGFLSGLFVQAIYLLRASQRKNFEFNASGTCVSCV